MSPTSGLQPPPPTPVSPVVEAALDAFHQGYAPVPIKPGQKRPALSRWVDLDFTDGDEVRDLFLAQEEEHSGEGQLGVGLLLGEPSGGLIDIDLDHPKAARLAKVILPPTPMIHGRPSRPRTHFWYIATDGLPATRRFKLPDGEVLLEIRSTGGQTLIPPTMHPANEPYEWAGEPWGGATGPRRLAGVELHARALMLALSATLLDAWPVQGGRHDAYLALAGGLLRYGGVDGETGAVHPLWESQLPNLIRILAEYTDDEDGPEARVHEVFESTTKALRAGRLVQGFPTLGRILGGPTADLVLGYAKDIESLLGFAARASRKPSDDVGLTDIPESTESRTERRRRREERASSSDRPPDPLADRIDGWEAVDLALYLASDQVGPEPGVLFRDDGVGLMYPGRVNSLYGASESGKTWIALHTVQQAVRRGEQVLFIDCEDGPRILVQRLRSIGMTDDEINDQVTYINPDESLGGLTVDRWGKPAPTTKGQDNEIALRAVLDLVQPSLIVIDGLTSLYGMHSLNPNDAAATDKVTSWMRKLTNDEERAVLMIDHTSKNAQPGSAPTGSQHKVAMVQGTALQIVADTKPRRGHTGRMRIFIGKDRPGAVREHQVGDDSDLIAEVVLVSDADGNVRMTMEEPDPSNIYIEASDVARAERKAKENHLPNDKALILKGLQAGHEPMRRGEIELAMKPSRIPENRFRKALGELIDEGTVTSQGQSVQTRYSLADRKNK